MNNIKKSIALVVLGLSILGPISANADVERANHLPKVSVSLKELPVKHPGKAPYGDAQASQYKNYINKIYNMGITTGYTPTSYKPNYTITRGEMAVFLNRLAGSPGYKPPFNVYTDVVQYKNQILWLTATTVSNGTAPHYNPNGAVTRGQMAAFLHRMAKVSGKAPSNAHYGSPFKDIRGNMFANDIGWVYSQGITTGYTPTTYNPNGNVTRGEMAAFISRFYDKLIKGAIPEPGRVEIPAPANLVNFAKAHKLTLGKFYKGEDNGDLGQYTPNQGSQLDKAAQTFLLTEGSPFYVGSGKYDSWRSYTVASGNDVVKFY